MKGTTGKTGITGARGRAGHQGPGTLVSSEHTEIVIVKRRIEDVYEGLTVLTQRTVAINVELAKLRGALLKLMRGSR